MLDPMTYDVNQAWVVLKCNEKPIVLAEGRFNILVVMDVRSTFVIGQSVVSDGTESPSVHDVQTIFLNAWKQKNAWPELLIIPNSHTVTNSYKVVADRHSIAVVNLPEDDFADVLAEMRASLKEFYLQ